MLRTEVNHVHFAIYFSSLPQTPQSALPSSAASRDTTSKYAKAADGDYLQANNRSQQTPDATGGYKPLSSVSSAPAAANAAATSSPAVQLALINLVKGG